MQMVQHTFSEGFGEIHEFQVVHALITQNQKGIDDTNQDVSSNSTNHTIEAANSQNNLLTAMCQHFNSFNSSSPKKIPKCVKEIISQLKNSPEWCSTTSANTDSDNLLISPKRKSCAVRYASLLKASNKNDEKSVPKVLPLNSTNVQDKVLQFEKQASQVRTPAPSSPCSACHAEATSSSPENSDPVSAWHPIACPPDRCDPQPPPNIPPPPPIVPSSTVPSGGKSLKRVPSARFQKIRRKVQRLMNKRSDTVEATPSSDLDSATFIDSIRIPDPGDIRSSMERDPCSVLRMPDHVLRHIFSLLDTRTLASIKCTCTDFNFVINYFDIRATDSRWTEDHRYLSDPCTQCRHLFTPGDMSMCRYHPKRFYSDLPYGRSYWTCCLAIEKSAPGCRTGLHDNHWHKQS